MGGAGDFLTIATIVEGGPAARLGQLKVGDRVLAINRIRMNGVTLEQAVKIVHEAGDTISMEVEFNITGMGPPDTNSDSPSIKSNDTLLVSAKADTQHYRSWKWAIQRGGGRGWGCSHHGD